MKERLTGAIILVALIVLLVPELLHGPIRPASHVRGPAAVSEEPPLRAYTINLVDESHGGTVAPQPAAPTPMAPAEPVTAAPPMPAATPTPAPSAAPTAAPSQHPVSQATATAPTDTPPSSASKPSTSAKGGAWVVQLGSFASAANAERLAQQVRARGFQVGVSRATTGRRLYRVQVGPAHDRASAEQMAGKLRALGHSGSIVPK